MNELAIFNWSGGKDSALCLHKILQSKQYDIMCLLTSISEQYQRISMHGVRVELLEAQVASIGIPLIKMQVPDVPTMENYNNVMRATLLDLKTKGATSSIFGDINLEDLRLYRENKLNELSLKGVFPLWNIPTDKLLREFIDLGFKTIITCVNDKYLDKSYAGRIIDHDFLDNLPDNVDPCGENGEYHTFVFDGPIFKQPILFDKGEIVYKKYTPSTPQNNATVSNTSDNKKTENPFDNGFWYCDLLLPKTVSIL